MIPESELILADPDVNPCDQYCLNFNYTGCTTTNLTNGLTVNLGTYQAEQSNMTDTTVTLHIYKDNRIIDSWTFDLGINKKHIFDNNLCAELISIDTISPIPKSYFTFKYYSPIVLKKTSYIISGLVVVGILGGLYFLFRRK